MAEPRKDDPVAPRRRLYKGISTGVMLICFGVVLLLNTSGRLGWGVWLDLLSWWPVLLIAFGLRLIFQTTPLHPVTLLGPVLIVATTVGVCWSYTDEPSGSWTDMSGADASAIDCAAPPQGRSATVRLQYAAGRVHLESEPSSGPGIKGTLRYDGPVPYKSCSSGGDLKISRRGDWDDFHVMILPFPRRNSTWEARLSSSAPVDLHLEAAAALVEADLRAFILDHVELEMAASSVALRLPAPTRKTSVTVEGAASRLALTIPPGACFTLSRKRILSTLEIEAPVMQDDAFPRSVTADACRSLPADAPRYDIRVTAPVSTITVQEG